MKKYRLKNKEKLNEQKKEYYSENKEKINERSKEYHIKNKEKINEKTKERYSNDIQYKLIKQHRCSTRRLFKEANTIKCKRTEELLGCSKQQFQDYIVSKFKKGMTVDNHGKYGWHLDHIKPCSSFDFTDPKQQEECCHYTNFQPLWWWENLAKGNKLDWKGIYIPSHYKIKK